MTANMTTGEDDKAEADLYTMDDDKSDVKVSLRPPSSLSLVFSS